MGRRWKDMVSDQDAAALSSAAFSIPLIAANEADLNENDRARRRYCRKVATAEKMCLPKPSCQNSYMDRLRQTNTRRQGQAVLDCSNLLMRGNSTTANKTTAATATPTTPSPISGPGAARTVALADPAAPNSHTTQTRLVRVSVRENNFIWEPRL